MLRPVSERKKIRLALNKTGQSTLITNTKEAIVFFVKSLPLRMRKKVMKDC